MRPIRTTLWKPTLRRRTRSLVLVAFALGSIMALAEVSEAPADRTLTKSVLAVERAINALATPSADPREILHHVLATLPSNSQEFLKTDVTTFLGRAPDAQADFKCSNDFVSYKARQELMRLKDTLLN